MPLKARALRPRVPRRDGGGAANDDPSALSEQWVDSIADPPGDIVEIDVDSVGTGGSERIAQPLGAIVDRVVIAELSATHGDFARTSGNADGAAAELARDLPDRRPNRAGGGRNHHRFTGAWLAD